MTSPYIDRLLARFLFVIFTCVTVFSVTLTLLLASAGQSHAARSDKGYSKETIQRMVIEEAQANGVVPPALALAVARVESNFQAHVESSAGARGVMQIMPATAWGEFRVAADRLWEPRLNIRLGVDYLERLYNQYGRRWELALSHYNGGTLKGRGARAIPHSYTRKYVADVTRHWRGFERSRTVLALADMQDKGDRQKRQPRRAYENPDAYWLLDDAGVDRGWRDYLAATDRILNGRAQPQDYAIADNDRQAAGERYYPFGGGTLRQRFRQSLERQERRLNPVTGGAGRFM